MATDFQLPGFFFKGNQVRRGKITFFPVKQRRLEDFLGYLRYPGDKYLLFVDFSTIPDPAYAGLPQIKGPTLSPWADKGEAKRLQRSADKPHGAVRS